MGKPNFSRGYWFGAMALFGFLALAPGCTHPPKVNYQFDSKADFAAFKTYAVEPTHSPSLDLRVLDGKPIAQVIEQSIEQQLNAKGLRKVERGESDLLVKWSAQIEDAQTNGIDTAPTVDLNTSDSGFILDSASSNNDGIPGDVLKGGIRVDLSSAQSQQAIWRGGIGMLLQRSLPDPTRIQRINEAVAKLFANYPPKSTSAR